MANVVVVVALFCYAREEEHRVWIKAEIGGASDVGVIGGTPGQM